MLVKDIFGVRKIRITDNGERQYPIGYPFERLLVFVSQCKEIVHFYTSLHIPKSRLKRAQYDTDKIRLQMPATTRWGSLQGCLNLIHESDSILTGIVADRSFVSGHT